MKKSCFHILVLTLFAILTACGDDSSSANKDKEDNSAPSDSLVQDSIENIPAYLQPMLLVRGDSSKVLLGTNIKSAPASEKPEMKVILDYDFYMGRHEVSCGEYAAVLKSEKKSVYKCENDSLPVVNITYYDAILWANAKSKSEKLDTVYDYNKITYDEEDHCTYISGLVFHPERIGFRLPTEAEWIKAASVDWDSTNGWNSGNSDYKLHDICSLDQDSTQFCDLAGNAMEWVNDWLGNFKDTTITNYVGASDGGDLEERILKGGSYNTSAKSTNRYSRGDVYTVTSSTQAEYVGFRIAFGAITNPIWLSSNGTLQESIVNALATPSEIYSYTKTYNVKMAFRNDVSQNLDFIDYSTGTSAIKEIADTLSVYHPEISPNGEHVAFCTGLEGISGTSSIYVRDLNQEGSNLVKLDVKSAAIPRWNVLDNGDTVIIYVTNAGNNKDSSAWETYSTWQVTFSDGKFGTPVKLFDGAFHGGVSEDNRLAVTGARLLRARIADSSSTLDNNAKNYTWYNGEQACNASLAKDKSKRTAFLDFSGETGQKFVGESYSVHERLLIADSTGELIQSVGAPSGYTFDHSEWAVGDVKENIVATLTNSDGAHQKITLVNLKDSSTLDLAEGDELWHPCFWIQKKAEPAVVPTDTTSEDSLDKVFILDLDSAGVYYQSGNSDKAAIMRYKMELLWQYHDSANVIILGSSRPKNGVIPLNFNNHFFAINLADSYFSINESYYIYTNYLQAQTPKLKYLIVSLDIDMWWKEYDGYKNFFYKDYLKDPGYIYDANHDYWKDSIPQGLYQATFDGLGTTSGQIFRTTLGHHPFDVGGWGGDDPPIYHDSTWYQDDSTLFDASLDLLKAIISSAEEREIIVIGVIFPQSPAYKSTGAFGAYGLQRSVAPTLIQRLADLQNSYKNFVFFDENKMGDHDYSEELARDRDHLATPGAEVMTARLDSILKTLAGLTDSITIPTDTLVNPTDSIPSSADSLANTTDSIPSPADSLVNTTDSIPNPADSLANTTDSIPSPADSLNDVP